MKQGFDTALDQCLIWLRGGMDLESCLAHYPAQADELRPLLELATQLGRVVTPPPAEAARAAGEQRMLAALAQKRERQARLNPIAHFLKWMGRSFALSIPGLKPAWHLAAVALLAMLVLASGVAVAASADSLPGDALYPIKLTSQRVQLALPLKAETRQLLQDRFDAERRLDIQAVLRAGRQVTVEFEGVLQEKEGDLWIVGGLPVTVQGTTTIVGQPQLGTSIRVQGELPGSGVLLATDLSVDMEDADQPGETREPTETLAPTETLQLTRPLVATEEVGPTEASEPDETRKPGPPVETPEPGKGAQPTDRPERGEAPKAGETTEPGETPRPTESPDAEPGDADHGRGASVTPEPRETRHQESTPAAAETPEPGKPRHQENTPAAPETPEPNHSPDHGATPAATAAHQPGRGPDHGATPAVREIPRPGQRPNHGVTLTATRRPSD